MEEQHITAKIDKGQPPLLYHVHQYSVAWGWVAFVLSRFSCGIGTRLAREAFQCALLV